MTRARIAIFPALVLLAAACARRSPAAVAPEPSAVSPATPAAPAMEGDVFGPAPSQPTELPLVTVTAPAPYCVRAPPPKTTRLPEQLLGAPDLPIAPRSDNAFDVEDQSGGVAMALDQALHELRCTVARPVRVKIGFLEDRSFAARVLYLRGPRTPCLDAAIARVCSDPGFADVTVSSARVRPSSPASPASVSGRAFDRGAAAASLGSINVASCRQADGPTGAGHVKVTFQPSGTVSAVEVDEPPFRGTSVGGCLAAKFRSAHVPPFDGAPVIVGKTFTLD